MGKSSITAHMIVKNEDRFVWYAIASVLPYVERFIIFDTGSTDHTVPMIKLFHDKKIIFQAVGKADADYIVSLRGKQIEMTKTDWIWVVDGDEIYPQKTAQKITRLAKKRSLYGIIVHRYDLLGDIYHCQNEKVGSYNQFGKLGHYVLRLINKRAFGELQVLGKYPDEYFTDGGGKSIKTYGKDKFAFVEERIFHAMYLRRSSLGGNLRKMLNRNKQKIELGKKIDDKELPEVFFRERPEIVPSVTEKVSFGYQLSATMVTPVKRIKRILLR